MDVCSKVARYDVGGLRFFVFEDDKALSGFGVCVCVFPMETWMMRARNLGRLGVVMLCPLGQERTYSVT